MGAKFQQDVFLVARGLKVPRTLAFCLPPAALESDSVKLERSTGLLRDSGYAGRRFNPLLLADCKLPDMLRQAKPPVKSLSAANSAWRRRKNSTAEASITIARCAARWMRR